MKTISSGKLNKIISDGREMQSKSEKFLADNPNVVIPYPEPAKLPWEISPVQSPLSNRDAGGGMYRVRSGKHKGATIIASAGVYEDAHLWYHVSIAREDRIPSYDDLAFLKEHFLGRDCWAIQVFVPTKEHVNIHPNALHLWHCITGVRPFPLFDCGVGSV
ncbi:MAG: hypothetical protein AAFV85_27235 [Cyanobacteria bacterium J06634_6]